MDEMRQVLHKMMDACALRHSVIAHNLANAETQGYRRQDVVFRDALAAAIESGDRGAIADVQPRIETDFDSPVDADGNNVSAQRELGRMAQNNLLYELSARVLSGKFATLRKAIKGR